MEQKRTNTNMYDNVTKKLILLWIPRDSIKFFPFSVAALSLFIVSQKKESAAVEITVVYNFTKNFWDVQVFLQ